MKASIRESLEASGGCRVPYREGVVSLLYGIDARLLGSAGATPVPAGWCGSLSSHRILCWQGYSHRVGER